MPDWWRLAPSSMRLKKSNWWNLKLGVKMHLCFALREIQASCYVIQSLQITQKEIFQATSIIYLEVSGHFRKNHVRNNVMFLSFCVQMRFIINQSRFFLWPTRPKVPSYRVHIVEILFRQLAIARLTTLSATQMLNISSLTEALLLHPSALGKLDALDAADI